MAERKFSLPNFADLTKKQDEVNRLPLTGQHLITGGPGTGKSVVALMRVLRMAKESPDYIFLVYNHVLNSATKQLANQKINSKTYLSWFYSLYYMRMGGQNIPERQKQKPDYNTIIAFIQNDRKKREGKGEKIIPSTTSIVIDEGQDMNPLFYRTLIEDGFENFFVVADQNQQITEENSSIRELKEELATEPIELDENFRNTFDIARLSHHFFTDPTTPKPNLPSHNKKSAHVPLLLNYKNFNNIIERILREYDSNPNYLIGVFCPNSQILFKYRDALISPNTNQFDNPPPKVSYYINNKNGANVEIDFTESGIVLLNDKSVKGTEFDSVFIVDIDQFPYYLTIDESKKKRFYVMISRARQSLFIVKNGLINSDIVNILPNDENLLKRIEI
ncbi:MAG: AAA family ATPase [Melioribacteraceae bacterium]|nr:AAA family ATPase [Melioribacteraceae bacterium]